ncbi:MAG: hypothetical protein WA814_05300 [Candidatus Baltobacteraceae bacterium]
MIGYRLGRQVFACGLVGAFLAGCGGQSGVPGATPQDRSIAQQASHGSSWMLPNSSGGDLLYVANTSNDSEIPDVYVFSYPDGTLVGTLTGFQDPQGICTDQFGDVFIADEDADEIVEYAHGGTSPIRTLTDGQEPTACAVDIKSGDLAVSNRNDSVSIYKHATGTPKTHTVTFAPLFAAYDDKGNLFIDGYGNPFTVAELAKGGSAFQTVTLQEHTRNFRPAGLQWNAGQLAFGSANPPQYGCCGRFYRYDVVGDVGEKTGSHGIRGSLADFFIYGSNVVVTGNGDSILIYSYPRGKTPTQTIKEPEYAAYGVTVSAAPAH